MTIAIDLRARAVAIFSADVLWGCALHTTPRAGIARCHRHIGVCVQLPSARRGSAGGRRRATIVLQGQAVHDALPHPAQAVLPVACWGAGPNHSAGDGLRGEVARGLRGAPLSPSRPSHRASWGRHWRLTTVLGIRAIVHGDIVKTSSVAKNVFVLMDHVNWVKERREVRDVHGLRQGTEVTIQGSSLACWTVGRGVAIASREGRGGWWGSLDVDPGVARVVVRLGDRNAFARKQSPTFAAPLQRVPAPEDAGEGLLAGGRGRDTRLAEFVRPLVAPGPALRAERDRQLGRGTAEGVALLRLLPGLVREGASRATLSGARRR